MVNLKKKLEIIQRHLAGDTSRQTDRNVGLNRKMADKHIREWRGACSLPKRRNPTCQSVGFYCAIYSVRDGVAETLTYTGFPMEHWRRIRTTNAIERLNREIRRRTRMMGTFPDGKSALMLVTARLKYVAESEWGSRRYLDASLLDERPCRRPAVACWNLCKSLDSTRPIDDVAEAE